MTRPENEPAVLPRPKIDHECERCHARYPWGEATGFDVISPRGIAHIGADFGMTLCGKDATGEKWWWPL